MLQRSGLLLAGLLACVASMADIVDELGSYAGYTIIGTKTITGYRDKNGKRSDDFEGCDFDRSIKFDDGTTLTCSSYNYTYAYRPTALILMKTNEYQGRKFASVVMIVEDEAYDMAPVLLH